MERINFNYDWQFNEVFSDSYLEVGNDNIFKTVSIPHNVKDIPYNYFDEECYQLISCYRKYFNADSAWKNKACVIEFEAVGHYAEVYVNGELVTTHRGGYTSFSTDISPFLKFGETNLLVVKVDSTERNDIPPFGGVVDYLCYGGIYREVYLNILDKEYIVHSRIASYDTLNSPKIGIKLDLSGDFTSDIDAKLIDNEGATVTAFNISAVGEKSIDIYENIDNPKLWDIDNPYLYTLELTHNSDTYSYRFGFREAKFTARGFYLNGKKVKIIGLNRHQAYPYVGYAMPKSAQYADADYLKSLGLNLARTSHYPNSRHFLDRADEIGLLVFTEIPGWQHISKLESWRETTVQHVREMIYDGYNHPSIILWGVRINESGDDNKLYKATNAVAHELDNTRQTGGVRCIPQSKLLEDVYTYNDFIHNGKNRALTPKLIVTGNKPYMITEYNGHMFPTKRFDHEKKRQEHLLRYARVINLSNKRNNTAGAIGWCMSDYNTHKDFGSGDKICYHGISDMFRIDKLAASFFRAQQDKYPVLEVTSNMEIGDVNGGQVGTVYMITNCDEVNLYKNGKLINTFDIKAMKKDSEFKYLKHPPIVLDDIIGNQIIEENPFKMSKRACNKLKALLLSIKRHGTIMGVMRKIFTAMGLMIKYKLTIEDFTALFGRYATNWGDKSVSYKFEGVLGGETVVSEKAACQYITLKAEADSTTLIENETYDVTRIVVTARSQTDTVVPYSFDAFNIETEGDIKVIGDTCTNLIGGARAFWIKSLGKSCNASVIIKSSIGNVTIPIKVEKITE